MCIRDRDERHAPVAQEEEDDDDDQDEGLSLIHIYVDLYGSGVGRAPRARTCWIDPCLARSTLD